MAAKKPKTNRGEPDFDNYQKDISRQLKGQKLSAVERSEIAQRTRFENDYLDRKDMKDNQKRSKQASKARQGRINLKAPAPRTGPSSGGGGQSSRYGRLTGGGLNKHGR